MDLFTLSAKLRLDSSNFDQGVSKAEDKGNSLADTLQHGFDRIKGAAKAALAAFTVKKAVDFVSGLVSASVDAYAQYEQLAGGVETLFKDSAKTVKKYASDAYKTSGLSANQYMETVTSFAASLIQSLGGDTEAAANLADVAITDMSDNANKMGTSIESIQTAYAGFAKGNYTMLDNLKLGYGGTKSEMDRLVKDAMKINKAFRVNTKTVTKNGKAYEELDYTYADVVEAIHIVQDNLGIAGATAEEASTTIEGSANTMKAAWANMQVMFALKNRNMSNGVKALVDSIKKYLSNILPAITTSMEGIGEFAEQIIPAFADELPGILREWLPKFKEAAKKLIGGFGRGILAAVKKIKWPTWDDVKKSVEEGWQKIQEGVSDLGGLIFGKNNEGKVNWPSWKDITDAAAKKWEALKKYVADIANDLGGLIFGKNDKGEVNWPSLNDIHEAAVKLWNDTKAYVANLGNELGKLVFGETSKGEVNWPSWKDITDEAAKKWESLKKYVADLGNDLGILMFGENSEGKANLPDLSGQISEWWSSITGSVGSFFDSIFPNIGANELIERLRAPVNGVIEWVNGLLGTNISELGEDAVDLAADSMSEINKKQSVAEHYIDRLEELTKMYGENATWTSVYQQTVSQLLSLFPELGENFDAETGKITTSTDALRANLEQRVALMRQQALSSAMAEQDAKLAEAAQKKLNAQAEYTVAKNELDSKSGDILAAYNKLINSPFMQNEADRNVAKRQGWLLSDEDMGDMEKVSKAVDSLFSYVQNNTGGGQKGLMNALGIGTEDELNNLRYVTDSFEGIRQKTEAAKTAMEQADAEMDIAQKKYKSYAEALQEIMDSAYSSINDAKTALESMPNEKTIKINVDTSALYGIGDDEYGKPWKKHAIGSSYVPFNNYPALLHRGEQILTASQARRRREGGGDGSFNGMLSSITSAVKAGIENATVKSFLNGKDITDEVSRVMGNALKSRRYAT